MQKFENVDEVVSKLKPVNPIYCIRKNSINTACNWFNKNFPGKVLYAVKTNPHEEVIKEIKNSDGKDTHRNKRISTGLPYRYPQNPIEQRIKDEKASKERFFKYFRTF